ncbi:MAG: nuclear transport factor 2 family protein [Candidatus Eremiobacteraeota bacterium]|nr:nuclear transport factor 2 family protein [Candidatus Eremiobacteraeota bacterium]
MMKKIACAALAGLALAASIPSIGHAANDPSKSWQDVRALVVRFNDAQNAHNLDVIGALMTDSPNFQWSFGQYQQRGKDAALAQLAGMYQRADWSVLPDYGNMDIRMTGPSSANIDMPVQYKASTAAQDTTLTAMVHEEAVRTSAGWRLSGVQVQTVETAAQ